MNLTQYLLETYLEQRETPIAPTATPGQTLGEFTQWIDNHLAQHPLVRADIHLDRPAELTLRGPTGEVVVELAGAEDAVQQEPVLNMYDVADRKSPGPVDKEVATDLYGG